MAGSSSNSGLGKNLNLVLVGLTGNGKSSTANSIVGRKAFHAEANAGGVTKHCHVETRRLENGQTINVIDTPGFFDFSSESDFIGDEVIKCVEKAPDGIHAFLLVFSLRTQFSQEEEAVVNNLRILFGDKVLRFMIVVFTGGDDLENSGLTLEQYLGTTCPTALRRIIRDTQNAYILFNNKTEDENKKNAQLQNLITAVETTTTRNKRPFMDELIDLQANVIKRRQMAEKAENNAIELKENMESMEKEAMSRLTGEMKLVEQRLVDVKEDKEWLKNNIEDINQREREFTANRTNDLRSRLAAAEESARDHQKRQHETRRDLFDTVTNVFTSLMKSKNT